MANKWKQGNYLNWHIILCMSLWIFSINKDLRYVIVRLVLLSELIKHL